MWVGQAGGFGGGRGLHSHTDGSQVPKLTCGLPVIREERRFEVIRQATSIGFLGKAETTRTSIGHTCADDLWDNPLNDEIEGGSYKR